MDNDTILGVAIGGTCCLALAGGLFLIVLGTVMKTRWGINFAGTFGVTRCSGCETRMPPVRAPQDSYEPMWGGWTCPECGQKNDKWGNPRSGVKKKRKKKRRAEE